jgi:threonine/homoserine/homoserine lactone efflux protein
MSALPVDPGLYLTFLGVMAVMAVTPGPANLFAVATGMARGPAAALGGVAGMNAATLVWFGAAALGLGALITAFPAAFRVIAVLGALYVAWLGLKALWAARQAPGAAPEPPAQAGAVPGRSALVDGFLVQILNPKAVLFFTVVLPPFLDPARPAAPQLGLFALATISLDVLAMSAWGLGGAALALAMTRPDVRRAFSAGTGVLLLLAAGLILSRL